MLASIQLCIIGGVHIGLGKNVLCDAQSPCKVKIL